MGRSRASAGHVGGSQARLPKKGAAPILSGPIRTGDAAPRSPAEPDRLGRFVWEIDENFARAELTDAQRAEHHVRREAILVRKGEVSAHQHKAGRPAKSDNLSKYSAKAAADLGVDERTVRRDLSRGKNIAPDVLAEVAGTSLDKGVVLDELARP